MYKTNGSHGKGPSVFSPKGMDIYEIISNISNSINIYNKWKKELLPALLIYEESANLKYLRITI